MESSLGIVYTYS